MQGILAASTLFLAMGLAGVTMGMIPLHGIVNECIWAGMALSAFITAAGLDAAS
jgi:hypothetical protein